MIEWDFMVIKLDFMVVGTSWDLGCEEDVKGQVYSYGS